ncbi:MAG: GFA family protein, partial [Deltaproteobacteria bacterium]
MRVFTGGCHCGRVRFEVTADLARVVDCNCSICTRKGYLHHIVPRERFRLLAGAEDLATYHFGTMTAQHHFCRTCGVAS